MSTALHRDRIDQPVVEPRPHSAGPRGEEDKGSSSPPPKRSGLRRKIILGGLLAAGGILVAVAGVTLVGGIGEADQPLVFFTVKRGDMAIEVTERGNLESQQNLKILCDVDDVEGDGIRGTPILWIIPNGSTVKKDELLFELAVATHQDRLDAQILSTQRARALQIQAKAKYENQIGLNKTNDAEAELGVELAELELEMFVDEKHGTHKLEVEEIKRLIDDINNQILQAQANLELKRNEKWGIESLFKLGYAGKSELDRVRLGFLQAENEYGSQMNKLRTQLATLSKKQVYEQKMQLLKLRGAVSTAMRSKDQVKQDGETSQPVSS